jgi:hypothetical protein
MIKMVFGLEKELFWIGFLFRLADFPVGGGSLLVDRLGIFQRVWMIIRHDWLISQWVWLILGDDWLIFRRDWLIFVHDWLIFYGYWPIFHLYPITH